MLSPDQQIQLALKSPWPPRIVSAIIIALIAWWGLINILPLFDDKKIIAAPTPIITQAKASQKQSLSKLDLFGASEKIATVNKASETKLTKLNFTLRGILSTEDPKQGIAQIQNAKKEERHFTVSDTVFGKATLEEIHADHVILLHNGRYEKLMLPEEFLNVKHFSAEQNRLERKKIATNFRQLMLRRNGETLRKLFGFDTAWKNGGFVGFIIKALGEKGLEMMETLGIKDGDLITVVNGLRFSESLEAAQQLTELKTATSIDIIIERNGQEIPFHIEFDSPIADKISTGGKSAPGSKPGVNNQDPGTQTPGSGNSNPTHFNQDVGDTSDPGFPSSNSDDDEEDLGEDWDESEAAQKYQLKRPNRPIPRPAPVEYDH